MRDFPAAHIHQGDAMTMNPGKRMVMIYGHSIAHSYEESLTSMPELEVEPPVSTLTERPMGMVIVYQSIPHYYYR